MSQNLADKFSGPRFSKGPVFEQWIVFVRKNRLKEAGAPKIDRISTFIEYNQDR